MYSLQKIELHYYIKKKNMGPFQQWVLGGCTAGPWSSAGPAFILLAEEESRIVHRLIYEISPLQTLNRCVYLYL